MGLNLEPDVLKRSRQDARQRAPCICQHHGARSPDEKLAAQFLLKTPDLVTDGRRADTEFFGCLLETEVSRSAFEGAQRCKGQVSWVHSRSSLRMD
jgi:hypothetical protein